jgi:hypothetical protein
MNDIQGTVSGEIVKAGTLPELADTGIRYDEEPPGVTRVVLHVEYADGTVREWDAPEPQGFRLDESMSTRKTGLGVGHAGGFTGVSHAVPSVSVSFTAHPRRNMFIWTSSKLVVSDVMRQAACLLVETMGARVSWPPGSGPGASSREG